MRIQSKHKGKKNGLLLIKHLVKYLEQFFHSESHILHVKSLRLSIRGGDSSEENKHRNRSWVMVLGHVYWIMSHGS